MIPEIKIIEIGILTTGIGLLTTGTGNMTTGTGNMTTGTDNMTAGTNNMIPKLNKIKLDTWIELRSSPIKISKNRFPIKIKGKTRQENQILAH